MIPYPAGSNLNLQAMHGYHLHSDLFKIAECIPHTHKHVEVSN